MYKLLLIIAAAVGGLLYYKTHAPVPADVAQAEPQRLEIAAAPVVADPGFRCEGKQHCSQMNSCAEARFYLKHCPGVKIDGDGDGIPCETPPLQCAF